MFIFIVKGFKDSRVRGVKWTHFNQRISPGQLNSLFPIACSKFSWLPPPGSWLPWLLAPGSRLPAPASRLPPPASRLPPSAFRLPSPTTFHLKNLFNLSLLVPIKI
jgi:hypothetical protein